jgi:cytosine/adenosine deaminase-related metal-dependent hydrolase
MSGAGFVNAHTHVYSGLASLGMPPPRREPSNFLEILEAVWWRLDRAIDARSLRAAARLYVADALRHGTTVLVDHHESPSFIEGSLDVIADACEELGIRAVLCYGATERNGGREEATRGLAECRRFIRSNRRPLVRGVVGLHASFTVSDDTIREAGDMCRELDTVVHVHVAEDGADIDDAIRRGYRGPVERLHALGGLPAGSILAHGVHLDAAQVRKADTLGCWIVQNPRSNRHNKVGYPRALAESARVAIGTDGFVSDMREEMSVLLEEALAHGEDAGVVERRAAGGQALVAEICGFSTDRPAAPDISDEMMDEIRADARDAAALLWKRMAEL